MKIESTVVFGTLAVQHYEETGDISTIEDSCDGIVSKRIFASQAEYEAYCLGIDDKADWYAHEILDPIITETEDCAQRKQWQSHSSDREIITNIQSEVNDIQKRLAKSLSTITEIPEDFLPHTVFVEEEVDGTPVYQEYKLTELKPDGNCIVLNPRNNQKEVISTQSICIDWLITLWIWYEELIHPQEATLLPEKELSVFLYPSERFERNATDETILADYEYDGEQYPCVERYTPDEFAALINDGDFLSQNMYVRYIMY